MFCARPDRVRVAAKYFIDHFQGDVLYAVKANPSDWVLDALYEARLRHFDVASLGEVERVAARFADATLAFMHPVKSRRAIARAFHEFGVRIFAFDSFGELDKILEETNFSPDLTLILRLAVSTDGAELPLRDKFGACADAPALLQKARRHSAQLGVSFHVGSQMKRVEAYAQAMNEASRIIVRAGVIVDIVDVGGGFPAIYPGDDLPGMDQYFATIHRAFDEMMVLNNARLWCEPGRALVAEAGSVLARVELRKDDALYLNDGAYGNLFDAAHCRWLYPTRMHRPTSDNRTDAESASPLTPFRFYGPTCDSIDYMPGPFWLPEDIREGDYVEIGMMGAYGTAMQTRFNDFGETKTIFVADAPYASLFPIEPCETHNDKAQMEEAHKLRSARRR